MLKKILIISSDFTGHGHKSITQSLCERFAEYDDIKVKVVDGFSLGGNALLRVGKSYGSITRNVKELWKFMWEVSLKKPQLVNDFFEVIIKGDFLKLLEDFKPDLILSVHPNFNGSILNILKKNKIEIPFITLIADLVSITPQWADSRADYVISPTNEAKYKCIEFNVDESRIKVLGFPVRSKFYKHQLDKLHKDNTYNPDRPLKCLIMSGGEGVGNMSRIAKILLENFNCNVKIVAGRNMVLRRKLENSLVAKYGNKVEIHGFVEDIQDLMLSSDIAFTRGSPNVMMEAVACNIPLVITGALPGQEEGNPGYAQKYNLGVVCKNVKNIKNTVNDLLINNAKKLNQIKKSQIQFMNPYAAKDIADFILCIEKEDKTAKILRKV
jgi:processive 1,2-diacylglycerol beta-glucosyltransferase